MTADAGADLAAPAAVRLRRRASLGRAGLVGGATLASRVLGLLREHIFAKLFGAGFYSDAFIIAYRIPNLLRDLFAEGALSSALVPAFAAVRAKEGEAAAFHLARLVATALLVAVGALTLLGIYFAPALVDGIAGGFAAEPAKRDLAIRLTRWLMPFLLLVSWAAVCRSVLNSYHRYLVPALAPALFNLIAVATGYALWFAGLTAESAMYGWTIATIAGGAATVLVQTPSLHRLGLRARLAFDFANAALRRIVRQMGPATLGLAALQLNILINSTLASREDGAVSWLNYAFRLVYLPIGVVGVAVATVSTVNLSHAAADANRDEFRDHLEEALRSIAFFTLPAMAGLMLLAEPIVQFAFEYGRFATHDTAQTAAALFWYATSLLFYSAVKVLAPAFYALDRLRIPAIASIAAVAANLIWSLATYRHFGFRTLAFGTALSALVNCAILAAALRIEIGGIAPRRALAALFPMALLAALSGLAALATHRLLVSWIGAETAAARALALLPPLATAGAVLLAGGRWLRLPEAADVLGMLGIARNRRG
ncbi:MAG: murein biosynthesis integral membrane protein MurJ, partial [Planctomycetes bacterium]|nr:murein biosynthesis integral membrane protein MurJ [Planctomycetota bacterium]